VNKYIVLVLVILSTQGHAIEVPSPVIMMRHEIDDTNDFGFLVVKNISNADISVNDVVTLDIQMIDDNGNSIVVEYNGLAISWQAPMPQLIKLRPNQTRNIKVSGYVISGKPMSYRSAVDTVAGAKVKVTGYIIRELLDSKTILSGQFVGK
jgi:hypothetical protein